VVKNNCTIIEPTRTSGMSWHMLLSKRRLGAELLKLADRQYVNVSRRAPPPVEFCGKVEAEFGRPMILLLDAHRFLEGRAVLVVEQVAAVVAEQQPHLAVERGNALMVLVVFRRVFRVAFAHRDCPLAAQDAVFLGPKLIVQFLERAEALRTDAALEQ
jgi:hypothetical protein